MSEHDQQANRLDDEVAELQEQSDRLGEEISDVRDEWESKKADSAVPGAVGEPSSKEESELPPPEPDETD
jgi:hypothetical protein